MLALLLEVGLQPGKRSLGAQYQKALRPQTRSSGPSCHNATRPNTPLHVFWHAVKHPDNDRTLLAMELWTERHPRAPERSIDRDGICDSVTLAARNARTCLTCHHTHAP